MYKAILTAFFIAIAAAAASAKSVAIITTSDSAVSDKFAAAMSANLERKYRLVDPDIAAAAFRSFKFPNLINLSLEESRSAGSAIGCDNFILIDAGTLRRSSSQRPEFYESYAAVFTVSSRSGRLILWTKPAFEADRPETAEKSLLASAAGTGQDVIDAIEHSTLSELTATAMQNVEIMPDDPTPVAGLQAPVPYRRIKPEYTTDAYLHAIAATVEILLDLDADGRITRTEINKWAGFGLDGSVESAVRSMNWRPAYRQGKAIPMRVLLRYNFKRADKQNSH